MSRHSRPAVGTGTALVEERPGAYRLLPPADTPVPAVVAAVAGWLAARDLTLADLRTGHSLEEAYLALTASATEDPSGPPETGRSGTWRRRVR